jgi:hypothetical protein
MRLFLSDFRRPGSGSCVLLPPAALSAMMRGLHKKRDIRHRENTGILHLLWKREGIVISKWHGPLCHNYKVPGCYFQHNSRIRTAVGNPDTFTQDFLFRKVAYTSYDVAWFVEWMDFTTRYFPCPSYWSIPVVRLSLRTFHWTCQVRGYCATVTEV